MPVHSHFAESTEEYLEAVYRLEREGPGVTTSGLAYPLHGETLEPGSSRGTSNVFEATQARVSVASGVVVAVRPSGSCAAGTGS